jgi:hypothetical protein
VSGCYWWGGEEVGRACLTCTSEVVLQYVDKYRV